MVSGLVFRVIVMVRVTESVLFSISRKRTYLLVLSIFVILLDPMLTVCISS